MRKKISEYTMKRKNSTDAFQNDLIIKFGVDFSLVKGESDTGKSSKIPDENTLKEYRKASIKYTCAQDKKYNKEAEKE